MEDKKTILMIANSDTGANGFLSFVERLKDRNDIRFVMVCHPRVQIRAVKEKSRNLGNASFKVLDFDKRERQRGKALVNRDYKYVKDRFYVSAYKAAFNTVKIVTQNRQGLRRAKIMMKNEKPDAVLLYADNKSELEKFFIYCAKRQRIPTIVAPICMSDIEGILLNPSNGFRQKKTDKLPITARIVKRINPRLEREYGDQIVFFSQPFREILERLMGFGVPNPWVQGSLADIVCTAYQEQYDETNIFAKRLESVNVSALEKFEAGSVVTAQDLLDAGVLSKCQYGVKILGNGSLSKKLTVRASAFSASAKEKIVAAGGRWEVV